MHHKPLTWELFALGIWNNCIWNESCSTNALLESLLPSYTHPLPVTFMFFAFYAFLCTTQKSGVKHAMCCGIEFCWDSVYLVTTARFCSLIRSRVTTSTAQVVLGCVSSRCCNITSYTDVFMFMLLELAHFHKKISLWIYGASEVP